MRKADSMLRPKGSKHDPVNAPKHYTDMDPTPVDVIERWNLGFHLGNTVKYIGRHRGKGGVEDLKKARWYLDRAIMLLEGK